MLKRRWCDQCQQHGHRKWLFLGTHRTHRLYLAYKIGKVRGEIDRKLQQMKDES